MSKVLHRTPGLVLDQTLEIENGSVYNSQDGLEMKPYEYKMGLSGTTTVGSFKVRNN